MLSKVLQKRQSKSSATGPEDVMVNPSGFFGLKGDFISLFVDSCVDGGRPYFSNVGAPRCAYLR